MSSFFGSGGGSKSTIDSLRDQLSGRQEPKSTMDEISGELSGMCPKLTYTQRFWGFGICVAVGFLLSFGSVLRLTELLAGDPMPFASVYSLGNIISLMGTCFLVGPCKQLKNMFARTRCVATTVYFVSIVATITLCIPQIPLEPGLRVILVLVATSVQLCAMVWYAFSYIPYGRACLKNCGKRTCKKCLE